jgi:hypothetical protein
MRAAGLALGLLVGLNAWVGLNLDALVEGSSSDEVMELDRRVTAFPHKERVQALVIGNSHSVAGLRPPAIAPTLGVTPAQVFNLSLPGSSLAELKWVMQRYGALFPQARLTVFGIDEYVLSYDRVDTRAHYLSRTSLATRWDFAKQQPDASGRFQVMAGYLFPLADFNGFLRHKLEVKAKQVFTRTPSTARTFKEKLAGVAYPYGFPPPWDNPALYDLAKHRQESDRRDKLRERALSLLPAGPLDEKLADLDSFGDEVAAQKRSLLLVEMPNDGRLLGQLRPHEVARFRENQVRWKGHVAKRGWPLVAAPSAWPSADFYDADHLTEAGSKKLAGWIAEAMRSSGGDGVRKVVETSISAGR